MAERVDIMADGVKGVFIASKEAFETWDLRRVAEAERRESGEGVWLSPVLLFAIWVLVLSERDVVNSSQSARVVSSTRMRWVLILSSLTISLLSFVVDVGKS